MRTILISLLSEFNLNLLLAAQHYVVEELIPLKTLTAASEKWSAHSITKLEAAGVHCHEPLLIRSLHENSITDVSNIVFPIVKKHLLNKELVIINLGNGSRMHILGLWHIQSLLISNNIPIHNLYYAAADVQRFQFLTYQWDKNGNCNEKIATMNVRVSFEDLIGLKGYSILNKAAASIPDITSVENKVNEICVGESGAIYECKINKFILKPLLNLKEPLPFEIYTGVKITHTNNPKSTFAEYDLLLFTKDLRIYIVEAKSGKSVMLKQIESQQKLATNWGGRFCDFSAVIPVLNKETLINSIERYKNKGIDLFAGPGSAKQDLIPLIKNYLLEKELIPEI